MSNEDLLKYNPFSSCVDPTFWHKLSQLKLDVDRLSERSHSLWGYYSNVAPRGLNGVLSVDCSSFNEFADSSGITACGSIQNKNTLEGFRDLDKSEFLRCQGRALIDQLKKDCLENPALLNKFCIISFADLKKHKFTYWFAFPALNIVTARLKSPPILANARLSCQNLDFLSKVDRNLAFCVVQLSQECQQWFSLEEGLSKIKEDARRDEYHLVFADSAGGEEHPGWPLRNFLALYAFHCSSSLELPVNVICLRHNVENGIWSAGKSLCLELNLSVDPEGWEKADPCVGWERNERGKYGPRLADLHSSMDPLSLAQSSVDLNLKLMKWQVMPNLNLEVIQTQRCLLLGAGTLGCAVARSLLAWGVRHVTFVDNAHVAYSNPVRQSLFEFKDVGKPKAAAAAEALKRIFPPVISEGVTMTIPMPGHPVGESLLQETTDSVSALDRLIQNHDVVFLLMDSRESRWLPTVIATAHKKLVMNAALGFDSYLVMRHGLKQREVGRAEAGCIPGSNLGCYFCSDVTAPGNSGQSRTLDQQCTVTRPAVSNMAGALAVELFVSVLQHQDGGCAPASAQQSDAECILGIVPHSIRGFLSRFQTILPAIEAFSSCVACSTKVVAEYSKAGFDFVRKVLDSREYLEQLTGLSELHNDSLIADFMELPSDQSDED